MEGGKVRWEHARLMPGAGRLLWHLHHQGVPMALATSTPRATFERKMTGHLIQTFGGMFQVTFPLLIPLLLFEAARACSL